ncbi:MAG: SUMF1/EgtB/PvdO family nonheme iron enzyme, partial [Anaerolineae bacterium]|nr:SUMF1/EgtB/PvdO family nonheme iron enzyme [Anaerolineae bacterium]
MPQIFISYARKDHHFVDHLRGDLKSSEISYWIDREGLSPGTPSWERAIRAALRECDSVLWIVSPDSFESAYVRDEISIARMYKRRIYPVFVRGHNWLECVPLGTGEIQYIDARGEYTTAVDEIKRALKTGAADYVAPVEPVPEVASGTAPRNPYKGLLPFTEKDAVDFFGREALVAKLQAQIAGKLERKGDRLLAVLGPSGAGKSSVVMAGLIPTLRQAYPDWKFLAKMVPGRHPVEALADALYSAMPGSSLSAIEDDLKSPGGRMLHRLTHQIEARQVVLYIDQFEELFTLTEAEDERQQLISLIAQAVSEPDGKTVVLLSMRADFYGHPMNYPQLGSLIEANNVGVLPMNISELRDAIEKPARLPDVALTFEDGLVAEIVFALRERDKALAGALPLLEFTLTRLFAERDGPRLTWNAYQALGDPERGISGVEGAIGTHCEAVFTALSEAAQAKLGQVFLPLVSINEDTGEPTRRRASLESITANAESGELVKALVDNRLLQTGREADERYLEITHEALFRSWKRLAAWIESIRGDLGLMRQYERDAKTWDERGRDTPQPTHEALVYFERALSSLGYGRDDLPDPLKTYTEPEADRKLRELYALPKTAEAHGARRDIGDRLAAIGDARPGVGVKDGVPELLWQPVEGSFGNVEFKDEGGNVYGKFTVQPFYIARYLVTYEQFQAFVKADDGWNNPVWWAGMPEEYQRGTPADQRTKAPNNPRDSITWYQSVAFARWLDAKYRALGSFAQLPPLTPDPSPTQAGRGESSPSPQGEGLSVRSNDWQIRLPTEWEWQWAAQGGEEAKEYPWGDWRKGYANTSEAGLGRAVAVGIYPHGAAACGALDLAGNLWEWCLNDYRPPETVSIRNNEEKVLRGGSFGTLQSSAAASYRGDFDPFVNHDYWSDRIAFREYPRLAWDRAERVCCAHR